MKLSLKARNTLLHAEKWVRMSKQHSPDTVSLLVTTLREVNTYLSRRHRSDCKRCKQIDELAKYF